MASAAVRGDPDAVETAAVLVGLARVPALEAGIWRAAVEVVALCKRVADYLANAAGPGAAGGVHMAQGFAWQLLDAGDPASCYRRAQACFTRLGDADRLADALAGEGDCHEFNPAEHAQARALYNQAAALYRKTGNAEGLARIRSARNSLNTVKAAYRRDESRPSSPWLIVRRDEA